MQAFFKWWLNELVSLLPRGRIGASAGRDDALLLEIDRDTVRLLVRVRGTTEHLTEESADEAGLRELARVIGTASKLPRPLLLRPSAADVLKKRVFLPAAARGDLEKALGFEIDRETPFSRDEVYWTYCVHRQPDNPSQLAVDLLLVPRFCVEAPLGAARAAGLSPDGIEIESDSNVTTLIRFAARRRGHRIGTKQPFLLGTSAAALVILSVATPFILQQWEFASAEAAMALLRAPAQEALALRQAADQRAKTVNFLNDQRSRNGSVVAMLAAVTRALPDDTYLSALGLRNGKLTMSGSSPAAAHLIALLGEAPLLREPVFEAPVVQTRESSLETFTISVGLQPGTAP